MASYGWVGKILRINLSSGKAETENSGKYAEKYIGGRGVAARIAWEEIPPNIDAYNPENRLIIMTGPLTGTLAPTSGGRMTVCGVAPQAYPKPHYTRSSIGGEWGAELKYAGYDGVVVHGKAEKPVHVWINDGRVEIRDAAMLWGLDTYATQRMIASELGRDVKTLCIGPAGENLVRISIIQSGLENAAGQGGFGAVMGSKNLKAITVKGSGSVKIARPKEFLEVCKYVARLAHHHREIRAGALKLKACTVSCTVKNCGDSLIPYKNVPGKFFPTVYTGVVQCASPVFLRLKPWEAGFEAAQLANMLGINHWEIVLGYTGYGQWLNRCKEAGLLTEKDLGMPLDLEKGEFWSALIEKMAYKRGIGRIFAEGVPRAADILGVGKDFLPHVAHGYETHWDGHLFGSPCFPYWLVSALMWALDSRDPLCHGYAQEIARWWDEFGGPLTIEQIKGVGKRVYGSEKSVDPKSGYEYKAQPALWHQNNLCIKDSLPVCDQTFPLLFSRHSRDGYGDPAAEAKLFSAVIGVDVTQAELDRMGSRIYNLERAIMVREGRTRRDDESVLPYFKRPDYQGIPLDEEKFKGLMDELYTLRGWDKATGWPTRAKLEEMDLKDVADELEKLDKLP